MIKHYVTFLFPGSFYPEEKSVEIKSRNLKVDAPETCFAYYLWDREEVEQGGETLYGKAKNKSGRVYFGEIMTREDIETKVPDNRILLSNMDGNKWDRLVKTRRGNFQPLEKEDIVLAG